MISSEIRAEYTKHMVVIGERLDLAFKKAGWYFYDYNPSVSLGRRQNDFQVLGSIVIHHKSGVNFGITISFAYTTDPTDQNTVGYHIAASANDDSLIRRMERGENLTYFFETFDDVYSVDLSKPEDLDAFINEIIFHFDRRFKVILGKIDKMIKNIRLTSHESSKETFKAWVTVRNQFNSMRKP